MKQDNISAKIQWNIILEKVHTYQFNNFNNLIHAFSLAYTIPDYTIL